MLRLEVEGRHVVQHQGHVPTGGGLGEAGGRDLVAVSALPTPLQRRGERVAVRRSQSQFGQHPHRIGLTGRLHQAREHQLEERLVPDNVEPELSPSSLNHLDQDPRALPDHDRLTRTALSQAQIQLALALMHLLAAGLHQHRQLSLRMRRPKMLDHLVPPANTLSDLHRRRSRRRPHLPQEHHEKARYPPG